MSRISKVLSGGLLLIILVVGGWGLGILLDVRQEKDILTGTIEKQVSVFRLVEAFDRALGFNGFIHNYKNYILRGDEKYNTQAQINIEQALSLLGELESYSETSEETAALGTVRDTLIFYRKMLSQSVVLVRQGMTPSEVDSRSRISYAESAVGIELAIGAILERLTAQVKDLQAAVDDKVTDSYLLFGLLVVLLIVLMGLTFMLVRIMKSKDTIDALYQKTDLVARQMREAEILGKVGYWAFDVSSSLLEWSDGVFAVHDRDLAKGMPRLEQAMAYYHPDDHDEVAGLFTRAQQTGAAFEFQKRIVSDKGEEKTVFVRGEVKAGKTGQVIFGVLIDVTDQMTIKGQYAAVKQRFDLARQSTEIGVWEYDIVTQKLTWDDGMFTLYGITEQDFQGVYADWADRLHPDDLEQASSDITRAVETNEPFYSRFRVVQPDGTTRWINGRAKVFADSQGRGSRMIGVNFDITETVESEAKIKTALDQAEQANAAKSDFLAVMSHEIRTPLNAIMGMLELLDNSKLTSLDLQLVKTARSSSEQLLTVLSDILDMSRIEAGKLEIEARPFNVLSTLQQIMSLHNSIAQEKGLTIRYSLPEDSPPVLSGDDNRIRQIIGNFLSNAIKFTPKGTISVDATVIPTSPEETDAVFTIKVTDQGIGIPKEKVTALFQPFEQIDGGRTRKYGGTGLGLSICKRLAEAMGGTVGCDSEEGKGSSFWLRLELPISHEAKQSPKRDLKDVVLPQLKILAAEDARPNQFLLINMLQKKLGMDLHVVGNGALAVEAVQEDDYDVILMDVQMPVMDGVTATKAIRALDAPCATIPIIGLTANALSEQRDEYLGAGMTYCLTKPIDWRELIVTLASIKEPEDADEDAEEQNPGEVQAEVLS
ncbi:hybrid sensor histidine kinase/response regulator [Kiloniella laminariae]|uniref:hybrid sensor histidine kinase/response regulator n=1 Tax=Kiloniella laminariae TaxID=454162 RepID=UPI0003628CD4|nr:hybrid sensor histidine kinase/response regulator [Kiloniella laminariae]